MIELEPLINIIIGQPLLAEFAALITEENKAIGEIFKPDYSKMDSEEIIYPELFDMRRQAELIMNAIERVVPEQYHKFYVKLNRTSCNKREKIYPVHSLREKMNARNYALQFLQNGEFTN
jgi:hypothetical protein